MKSREFIPEEFVGQTSPISGKKKKTPNAAKKVEDLINKQNKKPTK